MESNDRDSFRIEGAYPLWQWSYIGWLIPGIIALLLGICIVLNHASTDTVGIIIGLVASLSITGICLVGFTIQMYARWRVIEHVYALNVFTEAPLAFRVDPYITGGERRKVTNFLNELCKHKAFIQILEGRYLAAGYRIKLDAFCPVTFITIKPSEAVSIRFKGFKRRCRGLARGHWCEVEWNDPIECRALIEHELEHVILTESYPRWSESTHHMTMKKVREIKH